MTIQWTYYGNHFKVENNILYFKLADQNMNWQRDVLTIEEHADMDAYTQFYKSYKKAVYQAQLEELLK